VGYGEIIAGVPAETAHPKKGSVRSGMPGEDEELLGVNGIFRTRRTERNGPFTAGE